MTGAQPAEDATGVVRIATFEALPGRVDGLLGAAQKNASDARAADGCLSAEVCVSQSEPDTVVVVSRWRSDGDLQAFLDWHESQAHGAVSPYAARPPRAVHYRIVGW